MDFGVSLLNPPTFHCLFGIAAKAVAFTIWNLDQSGKLCAPESLLQGHAAWHVLGRTSLWLTFRYYHNSFTLTIVATPIPQWCRANSEQFRLPL